jgi:hypothetical protein
MRPELREHRELVVVEEAVRRIELGLDVRVDAVRPDERRVPARAEQEADRLGEDRLAGAGLAGDRARAPRGGGGLGTVPARRAQVCGDFVAIV